ncbi:hypothetical protein AAG906_033606 [Vitis piasezkii]
MVFLKSRSVTVHEDHQPEEEYIAAAASATTGGDCRSLTVWRKSLLFSCTGFTVIDSYGDLVYRVDNYIGQRPGEVTLMDASGKSVLTVRRRKNLRLVENWHVYEGEVGDTSRTKRPSSSKQPICSVKKHINILHANHNVLAYVFLGNSDKRYAYRIEGSYANRSCKVLDKSRRVVAEIKRKEAMNEGVSFGVEVFLLIVCPGFDSGFAMALVLLLDQMFS